MARPDQIWLNCYIIPTNDTWKLNSPVSLCDFISRAKQPSCYVDLHFKLKQKQSFSTPFISELASPFIIIENLDDKYGFCSYTDAGTFFWKPSLNYEQDSDVEVRSQITSVDPSK